MQVSVRVPSHLCSARMAFMPESHGMRTIPMTLALTAIFADIMDHGSTLGMLARNRGDGTGDDGRVLKTMACFQCQCGMNELHLPLTVAHPQFEMRTAAFETQARADPARRHAAGAQTSSWLSGDDIASSSTKR